MDDRPEALGMNRYLTACATARDRTRSGSDGPEIQGQSTNDRGSISQGSREVDREPGVLAIDFLTAGWRDYRSGSLIASYLHNSVLSSIRLINWMQKMSKSVSCGRSRSLVPLSLPDNSMIGPELGNRAVISW